MQKYKLEVVFTFYAPACPITARQYGEVVLPDESRRKAASRNRGTKFLGPGKEGMARVFAVQVQILLRSGAIAAKV
jgi:hypothetical protein